MTSVEASPPRRYRAYALGSDDTIAGPPTEFDAASDAEAIALAAKRMHGEPFELWQDGRQVYGPDE